MKKLHRHRLFRTRRIVELIRNGIAGTRFPSASAMAHELGVSWDTVMRDLDYLRDDEGAPIAYDASRKGYYLERPGWTLRPVSLTAREAETLAMAAQMFQPFRGTPLEKDLHALFVKIGMAIEGGVSIPFGRDGDPVSFVPDDYVPQDSRRWLEVVGYIRARTPIQMTYTTFRNTTRTYEITPVHLFAYHGNWYMAGFARGCTDAATFAVSRIRELRALPGPGWVPTSFDAREYVRGAYGITGGEKPIKVRVRISPAIAAYMAERIWHPTQQIQWRKDGGLDISFTTRGRKEVVRWALSWQPDLTVISPASLRASVLGKMRAGIKKRT